MRHFNRILKLAVKLAGDFDLIDPRLYKAEHRSPIKALQGALRATQEDVASTATQYHGLIEQVRQSSREAEVQKYLNGVARRISKKINNALEENADLSNIQAEMESIKINAKEASKSIGLNVRLNELLSFRITEDIIKNHAKRNAVVAPQVIDDGLVKPKSTPEDETKH